jgi:leucyl/phenylalanyl-tRNA---protein transferase
MAEGRDHPELHWIDPELRGILPLDGFHMSRKLKRRVRRKSFEVRCDTAFSQVIRQCAEPQANRPDTWINPAIENLYVDLFEAGFAHSVECWVGDDLVGGLYGVALGAAFFGESMFSRETDASKVALTHLVMRLRKGGYRLLDTQFATPHLTRFGVIEIARDAYRAQLSQALTTRADFPLDISDLEIEAFLKQED